MSLAYDALFWAKCLEVALIASVKFLLAPFEAERQGFTMIQSLIITTSGGLVGITAFLFAGDYIFAGWRHLKAMVLALFSKKNTAQIERKMPKKIKPEGKVIQFVRTRFGLIGIAFVTPCIISIPVGTLVAAGLYRSKLKIFLYSAFFLVFWSLLLNFVAQYMELSRYLTF
jgi:hypothetical protein